MSGSIDQRLSDEVEVLQAILMDDLVIKKVDNVPYAIETVVRPSTGDDVEQQYVCVTLEVKLTPGYPDVSPEVTLRHARGLDDCLLISLNTQIKEKLSDCVGGAVVFELIELIRENLTESNLPSERCAICLFDFVEGDVFIKTQCYHYFHSRCLGNHLVALYKNYMEELEKLPNWKRMEAPPYQQTCPVCRSVISCDVESLKEAPPPIDSVSAPPFRLTAELQELQAKMAKLLAKQVAKGGVVGVGDTGPRPLTITSPSDFDEASNSSHSPANDYESPVPASPTPGSPARQSYRAPYRGFNRRAKPGRRGQTSR